MRSSFIRSLVLAMAACGGSGCGGSGGGGGPNTAGYVEDGRRWLRDAAPILKREHIDAARLVRAR